MKRLRKICSVFLIFMIILIGIVGFLLAFIPGRMTKAHTDKIVDLYLNDMKYDLHNFEKQWSNKIKEDTLIAENGHSIPIYYIASEESYDNKTIILVHWHESNHKAMYPIAEIFLKQGFNVLLYDAPAHGNNTAKKVTFGYYEKEDLKTVIDYVESKMTRDNLIGALGQSMGAATVAYYSGTVDAAEHLDFTIIDSAFTSMDAEIAWQIDGASVPMPTNLLIKLGSKANSLLYGFPYEEVSVINAIKENNIPTLIMHSKMDSKCPYFMGEELFEAIPHNNKQLGTFNDSQHLGAFWDKNEKYQKMIWEFIDKYTCKL